MEVERPSGWRDSVEGEAERAEDRTRKLDDHSAALAEKLLQGWTLLNEHCPQCLTPLVRNRQKKLYCAACRQWILTEAEAAARLLQQRVDRSDLLSDQPQQQQQQQQLQQQQQQQNNGSSSTSPQHSSPGSQQASPASSQGPASLSANGKSSEIGHLRLSLASLRANEEKPPDARNPKRFASSSSADHFFQENGNSNGNGLSGVPTKFLQREGDHAALAAAAQQQPKPSKPALVLPPTVNPVNDILVARRTVTTLNEKLEGIRHLISNCHDLDELRRLFAVLEECIHAIQVTRELLKSVE